MARKPRFTIPGVPQHVVQRGNNREPCFFAPLDHRFYLDSLREASEKFGCAIQVYVPMTNHVHLHLTPEQEGAIGQCLQSVGRRYVRYVNHTYRRTGTLWEGRYKASLIETESSLLPLYRAQPGARRHDHSPRRIPLVKPCPECGRHSQRHPNPTPGIPASRRHTRNAPARLLRPVSADPPARPLVCNTVLQILSAARGFSAATRRPAHSGANRVESAGGTESCRGQQSRAGGTAMSYRMPLNGCLLSEIGI